MDTTTYIFIFLLPNLFIITIVSVIAFFQFENRKIMVENQEVIKDLQKVVIKRLEILEVSMDKIVIPRLEGLERKKDMVIQQIQKLEQTIERIITNE